MKFFRFLCVAVTAGFVALAASVADAARFDFEFVVIGAVSDGSPVATGFVRGLSEGNNGVDEVELVTSSLGFGIGTYRHNDTAVGAARWVVTGGNITDFTFASFGLRNVAPHVMDSSLVMVASHPSFAGARFVGFSNSAGTVRTDDLTVLDFTNIGPSVVPLPAASGLLVLALAGLWGLRRRAG